MFNVQVSMEDSTVREALARRIDYTDREIDKLVYGFYNLTDEEIRIVESSHLTP